MLSPRQLLKASCLCLLAVSPGCQSDLSKALSGRPTGITSTPTGPQPDRQAQPDAAPPVQMKSDGGTPQGVPLPEAGKPPDDCPEDELKVEPGACGCGISELDSDGDGTPDCIDRCAADPEKTEPLVCGCGVAEDDGDGDATPDCEDACPLDAAKVEVGACGCGAPELDRDGDATPDCTDLCPEDASKIAPGVCGCGEEEALEDFDDDGTPDCIDACTDDGTVAMGALCGCGTADDPTDDDADGTPNCVDLCPDDANKVAPGTCGCGIVEASDDSDEDGTIDCFDRCPLDPEKIDPAVCGCGVLESIDDGDGDGTRDCLDACPDDPDKTEPLVCGCGVGEDADDPDGDGTPDCQDACPSDPEKTSPEACGCGEEENPHCATLKQALVTRYQFSGAGTAIVDSVGDADGTVLGTALDDSGLLTLSGSEQFVDLPNDLLDGLRDATIDVWFTWSGGGDWQRVFDFGASDRGEGQQGLGASYLFLTCAPSPRVGFKPSNQSEVNVTASVATSTSRLNHVTVAFDAGNDEIRLYVGRTREGSVGTSFELDDIDVVNAWLGRSQFDPDDDFSGSLSELRIYDVALSDAQVAFSHDGGPNPAFLE